MPIDIIKDPVTGKQYSRDTSIKGSTYAPYTPPATPTNVKDETPAGTLPPMDGSLSNFRTVLRSALNEATQIRTQSALKQLAPLSKGAPGGMEFLADAIKAMGMRPGVETAFSDVMKSYEAERKRIEFSPDQFRSVQGGIYDLKNNKWFVPPSEGGTGTSGTGVLNSRTQQVLDEFRSLDSFTPAEAQKVYDDLFTLGFNEDKPQQWFKDYFEGKMQMSMLPEVLQREWMEYRDRILRPQQLNDTPSWLKPVK